MLRRLRQGKVSCVWRYVQVRHRATTWGIIGTTQTPSRNVSLLGSLGGQFPRLARLVVDMLLLVVGNDPVKVGVVSGRDVEGRARGEDPVTWSACVTPMTDRLRRRVPFRCCASRGCPWGSSKGRGVAGGIVAKSRVLRCGGAESRRDGTRHEPHSPTTQPRYPQQSTQSAAIQHALLRPDII